VVNNGLRAVIHNRNVSIMKQVLRAPSHACVNILTTSLFLRRMGLTFGSTVMPH
jgi:hypothetical protein